MANFNTIFNNLFGKPTVISAADVSKTQLSDKDKQYLSKMGMTLSGLQEIINKEVSIQYDRLSLYQEVVNCLSHPLMNAGVDLYASTSTVYNKENNATIWVTSENSQYQSTLEKLFDRINIEENIFDWAYAICAYGDLFLDINGIPKTGILSIDSSKSPIEFYRIEHNGQLIGFYHQAYSGQTKDQTGLLPPYRFSHIMLTGARRRRPVYGDNYGYRTSIIGVGGNTFQESTHYGTPLLMPALPVYKRLRLCEDCILMGRATKTPLKYGYFIGIPNDGSNIEAVAEIIKSYSNILKRARSIDTTQGQQSYNDRLNNMTAVDDLIAPVWGDVNQIRVEKFGGEVDIKWLTDLDKLEKQVATALCVPLPILSGYAGEAGSGFDNGGSLEKMDIRFGRNVRRVQRALIQGVTRLCQIHLGYLGLDPDPKLFQVHMSETSSAEDEEQKENLKTGVEVVGMLVDTLAKFVGEDKLNREVVFDACNEQYLKLKDLTYEDLLLPPEKVNTPVAPEQGVGAPPVTPPPGAEPVAGSETTINASREEKKKNKLNENKKKFEMKKTGDLGCMTPLDEAIWKETYGNTKVQIDKVEAKNGNN